MKATTLAISVPNYGCDKNCPYCISNMTDPVELDEQLIIQNMQRVKQYAIRAGVTDIVLTGKGEPLLSEAHGNWISKYIECFYDYFPIVLQTNGMKLFLHFEDYKKMLDKIDVVAVSIDEYSIIKGWKECWTWLRTHRKTSRLVFNLVPEIYSHSIQEIIATCNLYGIDQITFRKITTPTFNENKYGKQTSDWIKDNIDDIEVDLWISDFKAYCKNEGHLLRRLPYGMMLYDIDGIGVTFFQYCLQDEADDEAIRSLIFRQDGHVYTHWQSIASRIF